jgi:hypothetical protein
MEEVHESPLKWIVSTDLDAPFLNDLLKKWLVKNIGTLPNEPFQLRMFFPSVAKQVLKTQKIAHNQLAVSVYPMSKSTDSPLKEIMLTMWKAGHIPVEVWRSLGVRYYSINQSAVTNNIDHVALETVVDKELQSPKMPTYESWMSGFVRNDSIERIEKVRDAMVEVGVDNFCLNLNSEAQKITSADKRCMMLATLIYVVGRYDTGPEAQVFARLCVQMMFCSYEISEEIHEWLPTVIYDGIVAKHRAALEVFKAAIRDVLKLRSEAFKATFMHLASMEFEKCQFKKLPEFQDDEDRASPSNVMYDRGTAFTRLVTAIQKE